ncbi:hypothetical protein TRIATDRAFT_257234 [Trichoderma atroviride IMI 206040]|uniref:Uncharacterized protein n=1 Tax=Hypocrea atroviridis (strain ATCC 20476 / IMI 206040) TaxID=452589 RepID=G9NW47_HYPAI|nr:uncharacterized protein TRIATDRAFT_257234 [Trichoderma atroviride IMI 206040]EHK45209.1 hypothetical protein TRIATDRAFT_257234 [Trichoderma atroviride IMI 206040]
MAIENRRRIDKLLLALWVVAFYLFRHAKRACKDGKVLRYHPTLKVVREGGKKGRRRREST